MNDATYGPGTFAFVDSFCGLIPCKVLSVEVPGPANLVGLTRVTVKITAKRRGFTRGEVITDQPGHDIVPRDRVRVRSGSYRLNSDFSWKGAP